MAIHSFAAAPTVTRVIDESCVFFQSGRYVSTVSMLSSGQLTLLSGI